MTEISIIAAMSENRVIGKAGKLPWNLKEDLRLFRRRTLDNTVVMGRATFESIGKPLDRRNNIVVSENLSEETQGIVVARSIEEALRRGREFGKEVYIIGGARVYSETIGLVDRMYISLVEGYYKGDVYFPIFDPVQWEVSRSEQYHGFKVLDYRRKKELA